MGCQYLFEPCLQAHRLRKIATLNECFNTTLQFSDGLNGDKNVVSVATEKTIDAGIGLLSFSFFAQDVRVDQVHAYFACRSKSESSPAFGMDARSS